MGLGCCGCDSRAPARGARRCAMQREQLETEDDSGQMNIHHLELFYYVARHRGITEAVRSIPYGIQQPAVSGQVAQLEEYLGVTLFQRRPFALTPAGEKLYGFIHPFFSNVEKLATELQVGTPRQIRIGASTI